MNSERRKTFFDIDFSRMSRDPDKRGVAGRLQVLDRQHLFTAIDTGPERQGGRTRDACETLLRDAGFTVRTRERDRIVTYGTRDSGRLPG